MGDGCGGDSLRLLPRADMGRESTARAGGGVCGCVRGASEWSSEASKKSSDEGADSGLSSETFASEWSSEVWSEVSSEGDPNPSIVKSRAAARENSAEGTNFFL